MKKLIAGAAIGALLVLGSAGSAFAGERGGNGEGTEGPSHANSLCVYSGLEDFDFKAPVQPGVVQNWGHTPKELRDQISVTGAARVAFGPDEEGCNAHLYGIKH
ncbi:hypothetical protein [uncultured Microbacterium sp.]|jgi:hypothetical protein|uniref:hypothetical protein n=1 Tax=uncultured Microbacterium sp. TaxID=191216 RepID=UPI0028D62215|nr:hypothetical protein [uncultured Microbacterium sp.]